MDPTVVTPAPLPDIDTRRAITSAELGIKVGEKEVDQAANTASVTTGATGDGLRWAAFAGVFLVAVALTALAGGDESSTHPPSSSNSPLRVLCGSGHPSGTLKTIHCISKVTNRRRSEAVEGGTPEDASECR